METIDLAIILLVLWSVYHGWRQGFFKELVSMAGFFVGLFIAFRLYSSFGSYLMPNLSSGSVVGDYLCKALAFVLIWIIVPILMGVVANVFTRSLQGLHLGRLNAICGSAVSMVKYLVLMSFVFNAMNFIGIMDGSKKSTSTFYEPVASIVQRAFMGKERPKPSPSHDEEKTSDTIWIDMHHPEK